MEFIINAKLAPGQIVYVYGRIFPAPMKTVIPCVVVNVRVGGDMVIKYYVRPLNTPDARKRLHIIAPESCVGETIFENREEAERKISEYENRT